VVDDVGWLGGCFVDVVGVGRIFLVTIMIFVRELRWTVFG
jgi:hypothetical protein